MSNVLLEVKTNLMRAHTIFGSNLRIYDDYLTLRRRKWFNVEEVTMTTSNIAQVNLIAGVFFSTIQIVNSSGAQDVKIHHVWKPMARKAKAILDQKLQQEHVAGIDEREFGQPQQTDLGDYEKSLNRMRELVRKGKMTETEYERKRQKMLREIE